MAIELSGAIRAGLIDGLVDADPALVALLDTPQTSRATAASTLVYLRSMAAAMELVFRSHHFFDG